MAYHSGPITHRRSRGDARVDGIDIIDIGVRIVVSKRSGPADRREHETQARPAHRNMLRPHTSSCIPQPDRSKPAVQAR
jgi:hypothetical protein